VISVSVVVPTFRRPALLERVLGALVGQEPGCTYEIVVADDAASAETRVQVARWQARYPGRIFYTATLGEAHGPAAARNAGWRCASGEWIAFTDDDTVPSPTWLAEAVRGVEQEACSAAWGRIVVPLPERPTDYERDAAGLETAGFVTANCFVRRDVLERLGGFDESFRAAWREDSDLYFRLLADGQRVAHLPCAVIVHPVRPAPWGVSVRQQQKSAYDALLYRKHPRLFRRFIRPRRPPDYYAAVIATIGTVGCLVSGFVTGAACGLGAWVMVTVSIARRRLRGNSLAPAHVAEMLVTSAVLPLASFYWGVRGAMRYRVLFW